MNISEQSTNEKEDVMTNNIQSQELNVLTKRLQSLIKLYSRAISVQGTFQVKVTENKKPSTKSK